VKGLKIAFHIFLIGTAAFVVGSTTASAHQAATVAGTWKLNAAESNNPDGPNLAPKKIDRPRNVDTKDMTGGAAGRGDGAQSMSQLSPEETKRINMMLGLVNKAPQTLEILAEGPDVTIKQDGGTGFPKQSSDGKKNTLKNAQIGEVDIKVKIDAKGMTREIHTQDDLKIVETYALSADGKKLTVTFKESQPVMKIEDVKMKRVYDRQ